MNKLHFVFASLVALAACGGSVVVEGTGGTGAGTTGTGAGTTGGTGARTTGTGAGTTGTGGSRTSLCPASPPTGGSCPGVPEGFRCTYGDSVRPDCRSAYLCLGGQWSTSHSACTMPAPGVCGTSEPAAGSTCTGTGAVCTYGDSLCYCGCGGGVCAYPMSWLCADPPTQGGCPPTVPNDGTLCDAPGVQCTYGSVCTPDGAQVSCTNGLWAWDTMVVCAG